MRLALRRLTLPDNDSVSRSRGEGPAVGGAENTLIAALGQQSTQTTTTPWSNAFAVARKHANGVELTDDELDWLRHTTSSKIFGCLNEQRRRRFLASKRYGWLTFRESGYEPVSEAAYWIASKGGTFDFDIRDADILDAAFGDLKGLIASRRVRITGEPDGGGDRQEICADLLAFVKVSHVYSPATFFHV